ncbi:hypothetical protein Tcan_08278 [Toxocara canis]|uniref:Uncharacterized protein n=1 Tax=Toxocara canis TaxID=6265 RepID=A0A0B2V9X7_TOXCA|nr:hypothetical protein Tcan_08278 [Toxocara canis]
MVPAPSSSKLMTMIAQLAVRKKSHPTGTSCGSSKFFQIMINEISTTVRDVIALQPKTRRGHLKIWLRRMDYGDVALVSRNEERFGILLAVVGFEVLIMEDRKRRISETLENNHEKPVRRLPEGVERGKR